MKTIKNMWIYLLVIIMDYYLLPLFIRDTGSAIIILLIMIPVICFICSVFYGVNNSFHWQYAVLTAILFIPGIFIYYNSSAWVYIIGYGIVALVGNVIGTLFYKGKKG